MTWILFGLAGLAGIVACIYSIMFVIQIFSTSGPIWGLASLFIGPVSIIWLVLNWEDGKEPFLKSLGYSLLSSLFAVGGLALSH